MSPATMRIGVPLAASLGSTGAVGIFVGRHGRIRADSRDSARVCRFATSSRSYLLGDRRTATEEDGAILQTSALPLGYGAGRSLRSQLTTSSARVGVRTVSRA